MKAVASRLGHASVSTTMDMYAHALREDDQKAATILAGVMQAKPEKTGQVVNF
jgi:integrase